MIAVLKILLLVAGGTYVAMLLFVFMTQRGMVYMPAKDMETDPAEAGIEYNDVFMQNRNGTRIHGWYIPYPDAQLAVLFCHGNAGNISHRLETVRILRSLGVSSLLFDYSGYGKSNGSPSEKATEADARAAWDWLVQQGFPPERIIIHGRSIGGAVATSLAHELKQAGIIPAGLVLESTFTSITDMGARHYPWLPVRLLSRYRYDSEGKAEQLSPPALFLHSRSDDIVPFALGRKLYEAYAGPKYFAELRGSHNSGFLDSESAYVAALEAFLHSLQGGKNDRPQP